MNIQTKFCNGDKAWTIQRNGVGVFYPFCGTIGQIRVEITDSPGRDGEEIFDNYKPQKERVEQYMLVETGIGSGSVYTLGSHIFETKAECEEMIASNAAEITHQRNP